MLLLWSCPAPPQIQICQKNRTIIPCPVLGFPLCPKSKGLWLIVWRIERKWHLFNFILWTCTCGSSVFFCQLEKTFCLRMNCVSSALSAVSFAFPQSPSSKGSMLDDIGKRESQQCWDAARFRYLFKCPPAHQFFTFKDVFRVFCLSWAWVSLPRKFQNHRMEGWCSEQQEAGLKPHFKCR